MSRLLKKKSKSIAKLDSLPRYRHPMDFFNLNEQSMALQNKQINGELPFSDGNYNNIEYETLVFSVCKSRLSFRQATSQKEQITIADNEYSQWCDYFKKINESLSADQRVGKANRANMLRVLEITKQRKQQTLKLSRFVFFMSEFSKMHKMEFKIHPLILIKCIHPSFGYFNLFDETHLGINGLVLLVEKLITISKILNEGRTLHAAQLMSLLFWNVLGNSGHKTIQEFCQMLRFFKFQQIQPSNFGHRFAFSLKDGELSQGVVRFDLWRQIYLDRGL